MKKTTRFAFLATIMAILMGITMLGVGCAQNNPPPEPPPEEQEEVNPNIDLMTFELNEDGNTYTFKALDRSAEGDIKIPGKYEGKPVTKIGDSACIGNETIVNVIISEGITVIGEKAFQNCKGMESITLPDTLTSIENNAFQSCLELTSVTFPKNLKTIGDYAFQVGRKLENITFNEGLLEIGERAFDYSPAKSLRLPDSLTKIGWRAFIYLRELKTVSMGNKVTYMGDMAFAYADALEQFEFRGTKAQWDAITIDESHTNYGWDYLACKPQDPPAYTFKYTDSTYKVYPRITTDSQRVEEKIA